MKFPQNLFCLILLLLPCISSSQPCTEEVIIQSAEELIGLGAFELAKDTINFGLNCLGDTSLNLLLLKYEVQRNRRKTKSALKIAQLAEQVLVKEFTEENELRVLLALSEIYALRVKVENSTYYLEKIWNAFTWENLEAPLQARIKFIEGLLLSSAEGKESEILENFQEALQILETVPTNAEIYLRGQLLRGLGNRARDRGDFPVSLRYYSEELNLYQKYYVNDQADIAIAHYNAGSVLYEMHEHQRALDHYLKCYEVWEKDFDRSSRYYRFLTEAIGDMYWELGDRQNALKFFDLSTEKEKLVNRDSGEWMNFAADTLLSDGKYTEALKYYEQALSWRKQNFGKMHPLTVACQNFVGRAYQAAGKQDLALLAFDRSIQMLGIDEIIPGTKNNSVNVSAPGSVQYLLEALSGKGAILLKEAEKDEDIQKLKNAANTLLFAVRYLGHFQRSPLSEASKLFWNQRSMPLIENAIRAEVLLYRKTGDQQHLESAFSLSEKSRAFLLRSALQNDQAMQFAGVPREITQQERKLRRQLLQYDNKILNEERRCSEAREKQLELWREKQTMLYHEYEILINDIKQTYPHYFGLKYQSSTIDITALRKMLAQQQTAMIEFFEGEKQVYIFYLDSLQMKVFEVANDSTFQSLTNSLSELLINEESFLREPTQAYQAYVQSAWGLYHLLLDSVTALCPHYINNLLILPGEKLSAISFACLLTDNKVTEKRAYKELPYLVRRYAISYAVSTSVWRQSYFTGTGERTVSNYMGFAPDYSNLTYEGVEQLNPLPFNQREISEARELFGGKIFIGKKATEKAFREQASGLLHIAAHAWPDDAQPLLSKLLLEPGDEKEDGILHAYELYGMQLPAQLSILSACHTAGGQFERGEGMMSLERAFLYAGCPSLLTTLWAADDESTARLTHLFLEEIDKGENKSIALQKAQQQFLIEADPAFAIPFYWAGLRVTGNMNPLKISKGSNWNWMIVCLIACLAAYAIYWKRHAFFPKQIKP